MIAFLDTLGLRPGVRVEVREKHPFDGPLVLRVSGEDRTVGEKLARQLFVSKESVSKEPASSGHGARKRERPDRREHSA